MELFTPARHSTLFCDALLVDSARRVRPVAIASQANAHEVLAAVLHRVVLMGRSLHDVRQRTFCLFMAATETGWLLAPTEPFHDGVVGTIKDALAAFGEVSQHADIEAFHTKLTPWLAYERGVVTVLDTVTTHRFCKLAARHGSRVVTATTSHAPDPDVLVDGISAPAYVREPAELTLELDRLHEMPPDELAHLFGSHAKGPESS